MLICFMFRSRKAEERLMVMPWKINYDDIIFTVDFRCQVPEMYIYKYKYKMIK